MMSAQASPRMKGLKLSGFSRIWRRGFSASSGLRDMASMKVG
jgi:hypothetical protein